MSQRLVEYLVIVGPGEVISTPEIPSQSKQDLTVISHFVLHQKDVILWHYSISLYYVDVLDDMVTKVDVKPRVCQRFPIENRASGSLPAGIELVERAHFKMTHLLCTYFILFLSFVVHKDGVWPVTLLLPLSITLSSRVNSGAIFIAPLSISISPVSRWLPDESKENSKTEEAH